MDANSPVYAMRAHQFKDLVSILTTSMGSICVRVVLDDLHSASLTFALFSALFLHEGGRRRTGSERVNIAAVEEKKQTNPCSNGGGRGSTHENNAAMLID